jgi:8-oxo-dGTP pyrophosphatase MutT (NUDIX family)
MKRIIGWIGTIVFWALWPVWFVYFRISGSRSRVVVICGDEVLLVRGVLSTSARWSLPGGGSKAGESAEQCAVREVREEVGIDIEISALKSLGSHTHSGHGITYNEDYFVVELPEKPIVTPQWGEILYASWWPLHLVRGRMLQQDAAYGLKQYEPARQEVLL